ncbi:insulinase family protein, partial [bacterium]|nr:insulinase family protein [bacterium]
MLTDGVRKSVLDNGLTVLVKENHSWPVVAIFTYVQAGYFNEPDELVGISHMIEHMFFKGTERRGVGQIAMETKSLGGYMNASTIYDHTLYYTVLPSKHLAEGLEIQADAIMNMLFDPQELKKETEVVIQEAKRKLDMPVPVAREKLFELAFDHHRIRRWRIGTEEGLRALTREDYLTFYKNLYRPENIILAVVGDLRAEEVDPLIEKYYGDFERGIVYKEESPPEPAQREFKYRFMTGGIQQAQLMLGFHVPEIFHPDNYALEILASLLGRGRSSCLFQRVKEDLKLVNSISSSNYALQDLGIFMIEANVTPKKLRDAESAIFAEIGKVTQILFSEEDLNKARMIIESVYLSGLESVSGQANILAEFEALGDFRLTEDYLTKLYDVTADDVLRVAQKYFVPANCSLLEYVPTAAKLSASDAVTVSARLYEAISRKSFTRGSRQQDRTSFPHTPLVFMSGNGVGKEVSCRRLDNGLRVLIKENHQLPLASVGVFLQGGRTNENPK